MKTLWKYAKMNRHDVILLGIVALCAALIYAGLFIFRAQNSPKEKVAVVRYQNREVMRIDLSKDGVYTTEATLGTVTIEVKDGAVRVEKETSPYHYCSLRGWVKQTADPIVCLPNELVITIEGADDGNDINLR